MSKEVLPWVTFLGKCRSMHTEILKIFAESYIKLLIKLGTNDDNLISEMYMVMSYALLERLGEEED